MALDFDRIFTTLGTWRRWQCLQIILVRLGTLPSGFHLMSIAFLGFEPPFQCTLPSNSSTSFNTSLVPGECDIFDAASNETLACEDGHTFNYTGSTIVTEWDLVCDRVYLPSLAQTVLFGGQAAGATFFATMADKFGRRRILLVTEALYFVVNLGIAFIPTVELFLVLRFLSGAFQQGIVMSSAVFCIELLPASRRTDLIMVNGLTWGMSMATLSLIGFAFLHQTWRNMQLAMCLVSAVGILHFFFTDESVRWLYVNNRSKEVNKILRKAARANNRGIEHLLSHPDAPSETAVSDITGTQNKSYKSHIFSIGINDQSNGITNSGLSIDEQDTLNQIHESNDGVSGDDKQDNVEKSNVQITRTKDLALSESKITDSGKYSVIDVLRNPTLRRTTLIMPYIWIVNSLVYFGLALLSDALAGDRVLNFFLLVAATELPSSIAVYIAMKRFGRKISLIFFHILAGVMLLSAVIVTVYVGESATIAVTVLTLTGKVGISSSFKQLFMYTPELYPTNLRSLGVGIASSVCRIGSMLAPFARLLMRTHPWLPGTLFGTASLTAAFLGFFLMETRDKQLPQTIQEIKEWTSPKKKSKL